MNGTTLTLDPRLDIRTASGLAASILTHRGTDLVLDAAHVCHFGALGVQVLQAAARSWTETGHSLSLINTSDDCADQLCLLGFSPETVTRWEGEE
ncbi:STAS domain-containing protein [Aliiroseovarius sp.]|uniref:STAS domain-containing protein n=1 Tax=Aliiroseovarius sp. TaxID=1872442 RepID=UPI00261E2595|nr:STAS domain-containing protein [Aliiroseovarius sp.]